MEVKPNVKQQICESNKKVSYAQKSGVETKKANDSFVFGEKGNLFHVDSNEVIESALFQRTTRDCRGDLLRRIQLRRFRKIGSDEWFSTIAENTNEIWSKDFVPASQDEVFEQKEAIKEPNEDLEGNTFDQTESFESKSKFKKLVPFLIAGTAIAIVISNLK